MDRLFPRWLRVTAGAWFLLCGASLGVAVELARLGTFALPFPAAYVGRVMAGGALLAAVWVGAGVSLLALSRRRGRVARSQRHPSTSHWLHVPLR